MKLRQSYLPRSSKTQILKRIDGVTGGAAAMVPTGCACRKSGLSLSEGSREGAESDRNRFYIALGRSGKPNRMR
jgi:hypothetical protein